MPLYTYRCNDCDHEFQIRQRMVDDPLTECPVCEGSIRRVVSSVGVVFKGSGFYVTDNRTSKVNGRGSRSTTKESDSSTTTPADTKSSSTAGDSAASS